MLKVECSFKWGYCRCGCGKPIRMSSGNYLRKFARGHMNKKGSCLRTNGKYKDSKGYWRILDWDHPFHNAAGYVYLHRWLYEKHYNCILLPDYELHHINEIRDDNRIENLKPIHYKKHVSIHHKGKVGKYYPRKRIVVNIYDYGV